MLVLNQMKISFLILILLLFTGCIQKYYKNNVEIKKEEYTFYKNRCNKDYQEYSNRYDSGGIYAMGYKRHHDEFMRECMEVINHVSLEKKHNNYEFKKKESSEINIFKMENNLLKISK